MNPVTKKSIMMIELHFQLANFLSQNNLSANDFSIRYQIPISSVKSALRENDLSLLETIHICDVIKIQINDLIRCPVDRSFKFMEDRLLFLIKNRDSKDYDLIYKEINTEFHKNIPRNIFNRNIEWLRYKLNSIEINKGTSLGFLSAAFSDTITDKSTFDKISLSLKQERDMET